MWKERRLTEQPVELNNHGQGLDHQAVKLFATLLDWSEDQFRELGCRNPRDQALTPLATVQGPALLSCAFRDPDILVRTRRTCTGIQSRGPRVGQMRNA